MHKMCFEVGLGWLVSLPRWCRAKTGLVWGRDMFWTLKTGVQNMGKTLPPQEVAAGRERGSRGEQKGADGRH